MGNEVRETDVPAIHYALSDAMASEVWIRRGPKEGDEITYRDFDIQEQKIEAREGENPLGGIASIPVKYYESIRNPNATCFRSSRATTTSGRMLSGKFAIFELRLESEADTKNTTFSKDLVGARHEKSIDNSAKRAR
ncbi:MAG: hypothetical protein U0744_01475 [Gemmataceae bacterium]